jgi:uncharacterized protein GlcG (DUF336 family)
MTITAEMALTALALGLQKANDLKEPSTLAIVDAGGNLLAYIRQPEAGLATVAIAQGKAYTALALRSPSGDWMEAVQPGGALYGLNHLGDHRPIVVFGGGLPVFSDGKLIGAVGVSGGPVPADVDIAEIMVAALLSAQPKREF